MKSVFVFLLPMLMLLASCSKNEVTNETELKSHLAQYGVTESNANGDCAYLYWHCLSEYAAETEEGGEDPLNGDYTVCMSTYRECLRGALATYGGSWDVVPVWTSYPSEIDYTDNSIELEFKLWDIEAATYVSSPSSYVQGLSFTASSLEDDFTYDRDIDLGTSASLDGDTYTLIVNGGELEEEFGNKLILDFRLTMYNSSIPALSGATTGSGYLYDHVLIPVAED